jgi:hypothetical protein
VLLLAALTDCGGSSVTQPIQQPPPVTGKLFVANTITGIVLRFGAGDAGNIAPQDGMRVLPSVDPTNVFLDATHDRLAVVAAGAIVLIDKVSQPNLNRSERTLSGPATDVVEPHDVALDSTRDLMYVLDPDRIGVFGPASTVTGNVAPLHSITIAGTSRMLGMALDSANDRIFVSDTGANRIMVFDHASTLNGPTVPDRVISGATTQLSNPVAVVLDSSGNLIVGGDNFPANILVFANAATANGNVAPAAASFLTRDRIVSQMAVSPAGELFVPGGGTASASVSAYSKIAKANGNLTPARIIAGDQTGLDSINQFFPPLVVGVAFDPRQ